MSAVPHDEHRDASPALATALDLLSRGLWPVPIHIAGTRIGTDDDGEPIISTGKEPIGQKWGKKRPTPAHLVSVYAKHPGAGVGIKLGLDVGVIDIENDSGPEGDETLLEMMGGEVFESMGWGSNRGGHLLASADPRLAKYQKSIIKIGGLEIRLGTVNIAEPKQFQSVCPPTAKADGTPREWNGCDEIASLPDSFFAYLDRALPEKPKDAPTSYTIPIYTAKPGEWTAEERARAYLKTVEPAIAGQKGHDKAFYAAIKVGPGFNLSEEASIRVLSEWNRTCQPPWSEKELRHKVSDAFKNEPKRGWLLKADRDDARATKETKLTKKAPEPSSSISFISSPQSDDDERPALVRHWPEPPDDAAYHGPAGALAKAVEPFTEGDPLGVLVQTLVGFGSLVGRRAFFQVGSTRHYSNFFACTAGPTGAGRKGTAWDIVLTALANCDSDFASKRVKSGLASGEGLIYAVRDQVTKSSPIKKEGRIIGYEEEIIDAGEADKRLLVVETEFGRTLGAMGREGNTLSSIIRQAWDSGMLDSLTKGNTNRATDAHISIVAHVTEHEVNKLLTSVDAANGFANRFFWVAVRSTKMLPDGLPIPVEAVREPLARMREAAEKVRGDARKINRDTDANSYWHDIYGSLISSKPGLIGSILGRGQPMVMRLAMIFALLDCEIVIREKHIRAAHALWKYAVRSAEFIFGDAMGDRDADTLLSALRSTSDGLSRTAISQGVFKGNKTREDLDRILGRLVECQLIHSVKVPTDGAAKTVWKAKSRQGYEINEIDELSPAAASERPKTRPTVCDRMERDLAEPATPAMPSKAFRWLYTWLRVQASPLRVIREECALVGLTFEEVEQAASNPIFERVEMNGETCLQLIEEF